MNNFGDFLLKAKFRRKRKLDSMLFKEKKNTEALTKCQVFNLQSLSLNSKRYIFTDHISSNKY